VSARWTKDVPADVPVGDMNLPRYAEICAVPIRKTRFNPCEAAHFGIPLHVSPCGAWGEERT
jgi:hypothetical protein